MLPTRLPTRLQQVSPYLRLPQHCLPGLLQQVSPYLRLPQHCLPGSLQQLEQFFARQIKSFRRTSLMYFSPELMERIRQMEGDYETAIRQFYCRPPSTPGLQGAAGAAEQSTPGLQPAVELPEGPEGGLPPLCDASAHATEGLCDASAHATEGLCDASAHATEGLCDASAHATEGLCDASAPANVSEGPANASAPSLQGFSGKLVLVLAYEPCDEGFEEEAPPDPV
ncbi:hypothetical protein CRENBAI_005235 [Crenichthys baileyi]|uniref:Uncharacterized protein n=1 Tax=Crenichthys baileyi TaxID=28760 RepID=A0AAV9RN35_9TELE